LSHKHNNFFTIPSIIFKDVGHTVFGEREKHNTTKQSFRNSEHLVSVHCTLFGEDQTTGKRSGQFRVWFESVLPLGSVAMTSYSFFSTSDIRFLQYSLT